jgi:hypothetical protein
MIRINLLPQKEQKRKKGGPSGPSISLGSKALLGAFFVAAVLELGGLYLWYAQASSADEAAKKHLLEIDAEKTRLTEITKQKGELDALEAAVAAQRNVFDVLRYGKTGPLNTLLFLSYALQRIDATMPEEEYRVLTDLWTPESLRRVAGTGDAEWNPDNIWLSNIEEVTGEVSIRGVARNHEDVMTFMKRLRTGVYFDAVDFVEQRRVVQATLEVPLVEFKLTAIVNYDTRGYPSTAPPPEAPKAAAAPAPEKGT